MAEMNPLDIVLGKNIAEITTQVHMKRFGIDFTLKALSGDDIETATIKNTKVRGQGHKAVKTIDETELAYELIAIACVSPNFSDAKALQHYGVMEGSASVKKSLLPGEVQYLSNKILELSGFNVTEDDVDEAKN